MSELPSDQPAPGFPGNPCPEGLAPLVKTELDSTLCRIRRLGALAAGQLPWALLLIAFLNECPLPDGLLAQSGSYRDLARSGPAQRWLGAMMQASLLQKSGISGFELTAAGKKAVIDCFGNIQ